MSSSGLQRRRGGGSKNLTSELVSKSPSFTDGEELQQEGVDHKIGFDSRDIIDRETLRLPLLTLMEEVLLMGLKDEEGYLSFWNDNISYALRGCILLELGFRNKITLVNDPARRRFELADRLVEVIDTEPTGEVLLDETLKIMKNGDEHMSVTSWIDLLSGETWNLMKINYQLKQVRERLAKGLVDKGILRTERKNFFLFDMATHPVADNESKEHVKNRILTMLISRSVDIDTVANDQFPSTTSFKYLRSIALVCGSYAANVLENVLLSLSYDKRDQAFARADELMAEYSEYPFDLNHRSQLGLGLNLGEEVQNEIEKSSTNELQMELIAAIISVFSRMDSIL